MLPINQSMSKWEKTLKMNQDDHRSTIQVLRDLRILSFSTVK